MGEQHHRCRFWPHCAIHRGTRPPLRFSDDNIAEMRELHTEGWNYSEIARVFDAHPSAVNLLVKESMQQ